MEGIISEKPYGCIFAGILVEGGGRCSVRARFDRLLGMPAPGDVWEIEGEIRQARFGPQIAAAAGRRILPSGDLIKRFLANHVPGIGPARAGRLWEAFGENLPEVLSSQDQLDEIAAAMSPEKPVLARRLAVLVTSAWQAAEGEAALVSWLNRQGVSDMKIVRRIHRVLGPAAVETLALNPFVMVPLLPWKQMDELGRRLLREDGADPVLDVRRHVGAADETVKRMLRRGDTAMPAGEFAGELEALLGRAPDRSVVHGALVAAVKNGAVLRAGDLMRAPGAAALEDDLVARLAALAKAPRDARVPLLSPSGWSELLAELTGPGRTLTDEQRAAAVAMMTRSLACLVGGAGTGKTYTCKLVCDLWARFGGHVLLCALAGKAALRLSRSTGRLAKTLARTLAELVERDELEEALADPDVSEGEAAKMRTKLESLSRITDRTLVVVDEASMTDLPTIHAITKRLAPGSRLLLVGDEAQLPPIGFGKVFHELVEDAGVTLRLTQVHRQAAASGIPAAAAAVRCGGIPLFSEFAGPAAGISFVDADHAGIAAALDGVIDRLGDAGEVLVVTATIAGAAGVDSVNGRFHGRFASAGRAEFAGFFGRRFSVGEPTIFLRNDYRAGLFNGLFGRVVAIDPEERVVDVLFDGDLEPKRLDDEHLVDLDLAYAVTCHKCQGSSAKRVVIPVYDNRLLDRSWLYTAITRAEEQVVLVGDRRAFSAAVAKPPTADVRTTGLQWPPFAKPPGLPITSA
ncbi:AAA family ATPase [Bradyrhizobium sp. CCGUVB1N3]|uniref:AAA family ATPase n=1 Tax=Bradyrhizobium sp. CCGUVB1N3 TaxID=2949629 RepID=UPI0020B31916|nr:AAA family ATPase [Bradyrhizobium sp. CCGUVB1N3]MCP3476293.1 AAA family ATPase [Bradyrhizobium sp. CCGUVB1N3]